MVGLLDFGQEREVVCVCLLGQSVDLERYGIDNFDRVDIFAFNVLEGQIQVPFVDPFARGRWFFIIPISCEKVRPCACSDRRRCANFPNHCVRCNNDALRCRTAQLDDGLIAAAAYRWEGMSSVAVSVQRRTWVGISDALAKSFRKGKVKIELNRVVLTYL
ncbi:hypothetical protein TNIN_420671 [Trichonephila inaurata madagascariensis]|uniref:Uncharacterized protein n=1 Tax=Trichonephila inaurata madagascariensis TaxID=2747483 RepID=A0A8X7CI33_9ARAC|nr:hypothetical protein TNIN_420671 [Trichonephila inaurata madagascariensis]